MQGSKKLWRQRSETGRALRVLSRLGSGAWTDHMGFMRAEFCRARQDESRFSRCGEAVKKCSFVAIWREVGSMFSISWSQNSPFWCWDLGCNEF